MLTVADGSAAVVAAVGAGHASMSSQLQPGQWVKWTLESDLSRSFLGGD